jgi:hypothetical protein
VEEATLWRLEKGWQYKICSFCSFLLVWLHPDVELLAFIALEKWVYSSFTCSSAEMLIDTGKEKRFSQG